MLRALTPAFAALFVLAACGARPAPEPAPEPDAETRDDLDGAEAELADILAAFIEAHEEEAAAPDLTPLLAEARACTPSGEDAPFDVPARESDQNTAQYNAAVSAAFLEANTANPCVFTLPSGLQLRIEQASEDGASIVRPGERVEVHYEGRLIDGTVFDSSYQRGAPAVFPSDRLIAGWVEALPLMRTGEAWTLFIPANLAYGRDGTRGGPIGPNEALIFRLELISLPEQPAPGPGND
ncbi:MAG: FKBP-type peptidyl-prolyl cis-trans isomerase [Oceanicaulis sp.]|nr:FKBP-type peptidyl-prolyl cis-trans isomerase [Oceanicaulis sp.]